VLLWIFSSILGLLSDVFEVIFEVFCRHGLFYQNLDICNNFQIVDGLFQKTSQFVLEVLDICSNLRFVMDYFRKLHDLFEVFCFHWITVPNLDIHSLILEFWNLLVDYCYIQF